jgi:hypothetical protein
MLFDSTLNPVFGWDAITDGITLKASFSTTDSPIVIKEVSLLWRRNQNENGVINLNLLSDDSDTPGSELERLAEIDSGALPMGDQLLTVAIKNEKILKAKTRYWIQISAAVASGAIAYSRQHTGYGVRSEFYVNMYGFHHNHVAGPYIFKIVGDPHSN